MVPVRIFVSGVQKELAEERARVGDYLRADPLMRRFFEVYLFEEAPASDTRPDELYLDEVERCDIYLGLFGYEYGSEDDEGVSPTEREFDRATDSGAHRLIFVKGADDDGRHPKMQSLIAKSQAGLIRRRFTYAEDLITGIYAALVEYLEAKELIRFGPFDATPCRDAEMDDLTFELLPQFIRTARRARQFPLPEDASPEAFLTHLNLLNKGRPTNAAVLLFGKAPQRFLISSEIKCAHFHGTQVAKPIPSYQVYKGTVFQLVDQAVDFVLSKISLSVGTRAESVQAPVTYEIPKEVITEAIVNAVAHRDYTSNGSVQVMLFSDRVEVRNPGRLTPSLTLEQLRVPHNSVPQNPLVAESLYLTEYIERMGTGTLDMISRCADAGLPEPEFSVADGFVTTIRRLPSEVWATRQMGQAGGKGARGQEGGRLGASSLSDEDLAMLRVCERGAVSRAELLMAMGYSRRTGNLGRRIERLAKEGFLERTLPGKPTSPNQKYRLTEKARVKLGSSQGQAGGKGARGQEGGRLGASSLSDEDLAMLRVCERGAVSRAELLMAMGYSRRTGNLGRRIERLMKEGFLERTVPDKPTSPNQKYRLTDIGEAVLSPGSLDR